MKRIVATGATDIGQVRQGNEDAFLVADSIVAVADGMGGHLAGEVASAAALEPVADLDGRVFPDAQQAVDALRSAVVEANRRVLQMAEDEPTYRGMGTTLTTALVEGRRLHIAHVGDSRAYLLRDGELRQLTDDHTLVQHLIDEGQISAAQAAHHPQRSVITRAIGVGPDLEVDTLSFDLAPGDTLLLCSDGLTGVVDDETIASVLAATPDEQAAVTTLITRANEAGGPDNITVVLLRYDPDATQASAPPAVPRTVTISSRVDRDDPDWAGRIGSIGTLGHEHAVQEEPLGRRAARFTRRVVATMLGMVVLLALLGGGTWFLLSQQYFVGLDGEQVVIYRGIDASIGPVELSWVVERSTLTVTDVQAWYVPALEAGRPALDRADARRIIDSAPRTERPDPDDVARQAEPRGEDADASGGPEAAGPPA